MPAGLRIVPGRIAEVLANLPAIRRAQDLRPAGRAIVREVRLSVGAEFANQAWSAPDGSVRPWPKPVPFGKATLVAAGEKKPLVKTGAYFEALMGRGAGTVPPISITRVIYSPPRSNCHGPLASPQVFCPNSDDR